MVFDTWSQTLRVAVVGLLAYASLVVLLRASGKRTLSKLNAFDLVVTVALGSTLATVLLSADVSFVEGLAAMVVLIGAQFAVAWLSIRVGSLRRAVRSRPALVVHDGHLLHDRLRRHRVAVEEVRQALRSSGAGALGDVAAVVLETDGSLSVIRRGQLGSGDALVDVDGW